MSQVSSEDVRRAYYQSHSTPATHWIDRLLLDPLRLIVHEEVTNRQFVVPVSIHGELVTFGSAREIG